MRFTRARLAASGLAIAALTIIALAALVLVDLQREADLHRDVIVAQQVKDRIDQLRTDLVELRADARFGALSGEPDVLAVIEQRAAETLVHLDDLAAVPGAQSLLPGFASLSSATRELIAHSYAIPSARNENGSLAALALWRLAAEAAQRALAALERADATITRRINERTLAQLRVEEGLRHYVEWLLGGSIAVLIGLFAVYRRAQLSERENQRRIERLAHFDAVTDLPNRTLLGDRLAQEIIRSLRKSQPFAILLFDLDGFKVVNDTWGHAAGDRVLAAVAERARAVMRASDTVGRIGGDEFLAILPETTAEGAIEVADKLREALRAPYPLGTANARLGASVGVGIYPDHGADPESLQRAADAALYEAKREGRDRTRLAMPPAAPAAARETRNEETLA
jgi:diguanylate cyclase (GGDEF)-like protein